MSPGTALYVYLIFLLWLFVRDRTLRTKVGFGLWIPTCWVLVLSSRPFSSWFGLGVQYEGAEEYLEGSPADRLFFSILILVGVIILLIRHVDWRTIQENNRWILVFYLYFVISVFWSDFPLVAFKRWIKDFGNLVMVLVILTEDDPVNAVKTLFARCVYVLIPLSVLLIKYYPDMGLSYDRFTGMQFFQGVTLSKNSLGAFLAISALFLVWELLRIPSSTHRSLIDTLNQVILLLMTLWLFNKADSATSLSCAILGCVGILVLRRSTVRQLIHRRLTWVAIGVFLLFLLLTVLDVAGLGFRMLGRDPTLTGRTEIWEMVFAEKINPLIGTGFYSFWTGARVIKFWEAYSFHVNQAHNGYIETYLNGGAVGVGILVAMVLFTGRTIRNKIMDNPEWASVRLVFWIVVVVHNWTEASFSRLTPLWFVFLLVIMEYPAHRHSKVGSYGQWRGLTPIPQTQ